MGASSSQRRCGITLENVSVTFDGRVVLHPLNLVLAERRIAVIGANGSGKSTFSRLLNGLLLPTTGHVCLEHIPKSVQRFSDQDVRQSKELGRNHDSMLDRGALDILDTAKDGKAIRRRVGFVFQNPDNQIVMPVVEEDLAFGLKNLKLPAEEVKQRIEATLERYQLSEIRYQAAHLLSGGQKQLLAICGVLVMQPDIIIFDEPTTQLDLRNKRRVAQVLDSLEQQVIVVTHDLALIDDFDRVLVFDGGHVVFDGAPEPAIRFYEELLT